MYWISRRIYGRCFRIFTAWLVLLITQMTANSESPLFAEAARLVKAMQIDRQALYGLQQTLLRGQKRNEGRALSDEERKFYECVYSADSAVYVPALSEELAKQLSREEILQATRFFEGKVGKELVEADAGLLRSMLSGDTDSTDGIKGLPEAQSNELAQFKKTPAGKKILVQGVLNSRSIVQIFTEKSEELMRKCAEDANKK